MVSINLRDGEIHKCESFWIALISPCEFHTWQSVIPAVSLFPDADVKKNKRGAFTRTSRYFFVWEPCFKYIYSQYYLDHGSSGWKKRRKKIVHIFIQRLNIYTQWDPHVRIVVSLSYRACAFASMGFWLPSQSTRALYTHTWCGSELRNEGFANILYIVFLYKKADKTWRTWKIFCFKPALLFIEKTSNCCLEREGESKVPRRAYGSRRCFSQLIRFRGFCYPYGTGTTSVARLPPCAFTFRETWH